MTAITIRKCATRLRQALVLGMVAILASSCLTRALWKATDPHEYVAISQKDISEAELQQLGVDYQRDDGRGLFYVEKGGLRRLGDYSIRFFGVPVTVVLDAATVIVVGGAVAGTLIGPQMLDSASRSGWTHW